MLSFSLIFLCLLLFFPEIALSGSQYGTTLWLTQLIPTLLPFFLAIRLFQNYLPRFANKRWVLLLGFLCGYPAGAGLVTAQYEKGLLSRTQAYFYLGFVNNPSPMFVLSFCGFSTLHLSGYRSFLLFLMVLLSSFLGSFLFSFLYNRFAPIPYFYPAKPSHRNTSISSLDEIIIDSFLVLIKIGGYVVIFSILGQFISTFCENSPFFTTLSSGVLEITTGISYLQNLSFSLETKKILTLMLLSFGGFSAAAQTNSILSKSELSILPYLINKGMNALVAIALYFTFLCFFNKSIF